MMASTIAAELLNYIMSGSSLTCQTRMFPQPAHIHMVEIMLVPTEDTSPGGAFSPGGGESSR